MRRALLSWLIALGALAGGAVWVCSEPRCPPGPVDRSGLGWAHGLGSQGMDAIMLAVTWLGSLWVLLPAALLLAVFLVRAGRRRQAVFVCLAVPGASLLAHLTKLWVARPRPGLFPNGVAMPLDWSYPSAHAMQVTAFAVALYLVARRRGGVWPVLLVLLVILVGLSRLYLQVHYPSDVLVGTAAAALWVAGLHALVCRPPAALVGLGREGGR